MSSHSMCSLSDGRKQRDHNRGADKSNACSSCFCWIRLHNDLLTSLLYLPSIARSAHEGASSRCTSTMSCFGLLLGAVLVAARIPIRDPPARTLAPDPALHDNGDARSTTISPDSSRLISSAAVSYGSDSPPYGICGYFSGS